MVAKYVPRLKLTWLNQTHAQKNRITYFLLRYNQQNSQHNIIDATNGSSCFCKMIFLVVLYFLIIKCVRGGTIFVAHLLIWCITGMMAATVDGMGRDGASQNLSSISPHFSLLRVLCQSHSQLASAATQWFKRRSRRRDGVHMLDNTRGELFSLPHLLNIHFSHPWSDCLLRAAITLSGFDWILKMIFNNVSLSAVREARLEISVQS